jgi:hypothetical protein
VIRGVAYGFLIGQVGSVVFGAIYGGAIGYYIGSSDMSPEELKRFTENLGPLSFLGLFVLTINLAIYFLSGYICTKVSSTSNLRSCIYLVIAILVFNAVFSLVMQTFDPLAILYYGLNSIAVLAGGVAWLKHSS